MDKIRTGVFGGNFDPFHFGHLSSVIEVAEHFGLERMKVIPAATSPLRIQTQSSTPEQRLHMLKLGIEGHEELIEVDSREIDRGGVSYTIDTLKSLDKEGDKHLFLIVGMDQFMKFDQWKNFSTILEIADLIVTTRPGLELPHDLEDWPLGVRNFVDDFDSQQAMLKTGRTIYFFKLEDVECSGTEIRKKVRIGQTIHSLVAPAVEKYIREQKLFSSAQKNIGDFDKFTDYCAKILNEKGGISVEKFDLRDRSAPSEFTLICSGTSTRHATALAEHLIKEVKKDYNVWPESIEGQGEGRWIVVDYGALIVHSFYDFVRQEYRLENLWKKPPKPQ